MSCFETPCTELKHWMGRYFSLTLAAMSSALHPVAGVLLLLAAGCAGYITVDGYEAAYVDAPADYQRYPRYEHNGVAVYEVNGRYYRQYGGRWVAYRERPRELREERKDDHRDHH